MVITKKEKRCDYKNESSNNLLALGFSFYLSFFILFPSEDLKEISSDICEKRKGTFERICLVWDSFLNSLFCLLPTNVYNISDLMNYFISCSTL